MTRLRTDGGSGERTPTRRETRTTPTEAPRPRSAAARRCDSTEPTSGRALLTADEARAAIVRSAVECLRNGAGDPAHLRSILQPSDDRRHPTDDGEDRAAPRALASHAAPGESADEALARRHRDVLRLVAEAGHGWLIVDETAGILSATGLDDGELRNVDAIAAQLATEVPT